MKQSKLKKNLTFLDVFCLASGAMISSGLFVLPGIAHAKVGPALCLSYFIAGLMALTGVFSQAELVSAMPKSGGAYFFVTRSLGPAIGTIQGILTWFSLLLKAAFALVGIVAFVNLIFPSLAQTMDVIPWLGILIALVFIFLNFMGAKKAGQAQVYLVFFLIVALIIYVVTGINQVEVSHYVPFAPEGYDSIFIIAGFIFVSYGGLLKVASVAEEVKYAEKVVPKAMIAALFVVTILYSVVVFLTTGILGAEQLDGSLTPLSDAAQITMGTGGVVLLSLAAIASFITTANAGLMSASRYPMALGRDKLLPSIFEKLHPQFQTPYISIFLSGAVLILCLFLKLDILVELASTVLILTFILSHLSVLILRESKIQNYQPVFQSPFYPWVQIFGLILFMYILFQMSQEVFFVKIVLVITALFVYWFYGRIRSEQKFAFLHILERLTAKEFATEQLENEFKEIIRERDEIINDRFDNLVEHCEVLDFDDEIDLHQLFDQSAQIIARKTGQSKENIELDLLKREHDVSSTINDSVAIPHIVIPGEKSFGLILARAREGVIFDDNHPDVQAIFVLYGSQDERNFHLRALSAIAQIVSDPKFEKKWMYAKNNQGLKDVILLGKRKRKQSNT